MPPAGCPQVPAGVPWMLDDDGIRQFFLAHPFFQHDAHAACVRKYRNQGDTGKVTGQVGQVKRQARAHDDRVGAAHAGLAHVGGMRSDRFHDVDGNRAVAGGDIQGHADFTVQGDEIELVQHITVPASGGSLQQVRVMVAQVYARYRAQSAERGDIPGQPVRGNADTHAALDDGQQ